MLGYRATGVVGGLEGSKGRATDAVIILTAVVKLLQRILNG